jgi:CBS domain-containing protein
MAIHKLARAALEVAPDRSVREAIELMAKHEVGAITVTQQGQPIGIFTERDLLRRVVLERRDPTETRVSEVMSTPVDTVPASMSFEEAVAIMRTRHHRHLVVLDEQGAVAGIVALRYVLYDMMDEAARKVDSLQAYVMADAPGG